MTVDPEVIRLALGELDPSNDDHWTAQGLPRVEVVSKAVGAEVLRQHITDAAPKFVRYADVDAEPKEPTLDEKIAEAEEAEQNAQMELERAKERLQRAHRAADALRTERDKGRDQRVENQLAIRAALQASAEERRRKAQDMGKLRRLVADMGIKL